MSWTTPADLHAQVQRLWDRGDLLRAAVSDAVSWPLRLTLKAPGAADLSDRFEAVRDWVRAVADTPQVRIDWRDWNHRVQGTQRLPAAVWVDSLQEALAFIGKARQAQRFEALWQQTAAAQPALLAWMSRRPLQALDLADRWERLLAVVAWLQAHPRPGVYLRQVDAPGVDSKFIEAHRGVLTELLDLALPPEVIDTRATGVGAVRPPIRLPGQAGPDPVPSARPGLAQPAGLRGAARHHAGRCELRGAGAARRARLHHRERDQLPRLPAGGATPSSSSALATVGRRWRAPRGCIDAGCTTGATSTPTASPSSTSCVATFRTRRRS